MSKIIIIIIYVSSLLVYLLNTNSYLNLMSLFILFLIIIYNLILSLLSKKGIKIIILNDVFVLVILMITFLYTPFSGVTKIKDGEYKSYIKTQNNKIRKIYQNITIVKNNGVKFIKLKDDSSFLTKKEYKKNIRINDLKINILSEGKYFTGNYILYIKNNISGQTQEYLISNNGKIQLNKHLKISLLNKNNDFKNLGKAIEISYNFSKSPREYKQWLYKKYKEFNLITSSDDPLTIVYVGDEVKNIYKIKIKFIPPAHKETIYLLIVMSMMFLLLLFFNKKKDENENKIF